MSLRTNMEGLESLPLKLMIVAVVASLSVIPAVGALDSLRNRDFVNKVELQLDSITSAAQMLAIGGPGGARTMRLDFSSQGRVAFERIVIGDSEGGPNMSSVVLRFSNGAIIIKTCSDPPVWMRAKERQSLAIDHPRFDLRLSAQIDGRTQFILAEVI